MKYQLGLIGYPIQHSLSPWIHEQFFKRTNLHGEYSIYEINPEQPFHEQMESLKHSNIDGFNVTVPYKEAIIEYLDEIDEQAVKIGAVNTVLCEDGKWFGYNTDGIGYVRSLISKFPSLTSKKNQSILILGAGGAAKGIFHALIDNGYKDITVANRSIDKAKNIAKCCEHAKAIPLREAEEQVNHYNLIIQTSSVGMKPNVDQSIISFHSLKEDAIVSDIVYQPLMTAFLQQAKTLHRHIHFGHTMLLYQAQYAFEIWTKTIPSVENLEVKLQQILEG